MEGLFEEEGRVEELELDDVLFAHPMEERYESRPGHT